MPDSSATVSATRDPRPVGAPAQTDRRVVVVGQNPLDPKAWSRTPLNVCNALGRAGLLHGTIRTVDHPARWLRGVARVVSRLNYPGSTEIYRGYPSRYFRGRALGRAYAASGATHVLHMPDGFHLPPHRGGAADRNIRHYYYFDITFRTPGIPDIFRRWGLSKKLLRDLERAEEETYRRMDHLFPISRHVRDTLVNEYGVDPAKITVAGTGSGQIEPYHGPKDYANGLVLFCAKGRLEDKGAIPLAQGFKLAQARSPKLRLVMVGDERYKQLVEGVPNAEAHSFVSREQLVQFFHGASLFVMPAEREVWGLVFLEALNCRIPVVGLDRHAVPELTGDGRYGFILKHGTPDELADTIVDATADPQRLARMGAEGRAYVSEHFTWDRTVERMAEVMFAR